MENKDCIRGQSFEEHREPLTEREYKRSKTLTSVDWKLLLAFNPPPGYRKCSNSRAPVVSENDVRNDKEDKVLGILRNILRDLENEIREDRMRLKEERRLKREERRQRRQETFNEEMAQSNNKRSFRTASPRPLFSTPIDRQKNTGNEAVNLYSDLSFVGVGNLTRIEETPGTRRTGSGLRRDWSRHLHEPDEELEPISSGKSEADSNSTTDTLTDRTFSRDAGDTSFESGGSTPSSGISRAKTSYVNDDAQRNSYVRIMDARRKRLIFRKQMKRSAELSDLKRNSGPNQNQTDDVDDEKEQPFSIETLLKSEISPRTSSGQNTSLLCKSSPDTTANLRQDGTSLNIARYHTKQDSVADSRNVGKFSDNQDHTKSPETASFDVKDRHQLSPINSAKKNTPPKKPVRYKLRKNCESSSENSPTVLSSKMNFERGQEVNTTSDRIPRPMVLPRGRHSGREERARPDTERSHSGTSGYSTDEQSWKASDSEEEEQKCYDDVIVRNYREQLNKYFMVLRNGEKMAVMLDNTGRPAEDSLSLTNTVTMSDLAIPDHVGWIIHQSEQRKMWGVVVDMLFCIFEDQEKDKPEEVILLPGCNIRPLVYKTAINGVHTRKPAKTITGIAKYQIVIDNASTRKKHLFGLESHTELDTWYSVLKRASSLDPESTNELASVSRRGSFSSADDKSDSKSSETGYMPSKDSMSRVQKLSISPLSSPRSESPKPSLNGVSERCNSPSFYKQSGNQHSPRGHPLVRHDSRRHSIQDIKKHLRREQDQDATKNQPLKAHHFAPQASEPIKEQLPEKKLRSFGSFESLLKFKKKRKKKKSLSEDSNDETGSVISTSSIEQEMTSESLDISAKSSKLKKTKRLSKSLDSGDSRKENNGLVRRASDIKDKVFPKRVPKTKVTLGELGDVSIHGFLYHKHHLKWHKLWCAVCRGCFYGFKSQTPSESAQLSVVLANCAVVYVTRKEKRDKHLYVFKLSQEGKKSIYLCSSDYRELQQWLTVLQMESNSVLVNAEEIRLFGDTESESFGSSFSSPNGSVLSMHTNQTSHDQGENAENSRSRPKKKKQAPPKPPRHSSCPPSVSRDQIPSHTGSDTSTTDEAGRKESTSSQSESSSMYGSRDDLPQHDKALVHVWQNDRGYLFNVIRAKLTAYKARKNSGEIYNQDLNGFNNEGLLVVQDASKRKGSRHLRRSRSFIANPDMSDTEPNQQSDTTTESSMGNLRRRHKPLVVKKISAKDLELKQTTAGYMQKKSLSAQWIRYWFVLHEGTLFCYLTPDDHLTVDVLNLHGYTVTSLVDQFRGKRFVLQLSHENFTSTYLSLDTRDEMDQWCEFLQQATKRPSSTFKDNTDEEEELGACAGCEENRREDVGERRKQVKQKLLEEMLRQKHELEKKQAERHKKQRSKENDSPDKSPNSGDFITEEQRTSDVTRLRQRRLSTQLKVDTIQKQMDKPNQNKKGLFGFGKSKKVDENKNMFLQDQLKELTNKLQKIDTDLSQVEQQDNIFENFDVNQNSKHMSLNLSGELSSDQINEQDGGINNKRSSSVKTTMQKWTNKTFAKNSTKKKQTSSGKLISNGSIPEFISKQNGGLDYIDGNGNENGHPEFGIDSDSNSEDLLSSSFTDLTRPTTDLKLDLNPAYQPQNSMDASPTSSKYTRSNSRSSTISSLSSPRREINPSVLAEIDAFEELTRQVLGARSKD